MSQKYSEQLELQVTMCEAVGGKTIQVNLTDAKDLLKEIANAKRDALRAKLADAEREVREYKSAASAEANQVDRLTAEIKRMKKVVDEAERAINDPGNDLEDLYRVVTEFKKGVTK